MRRQRSTAADLALVAHRVGSTGISQGSGGIMCSFAPTPHVSCLPCPFVHEIPQFDQGSSGSRCRGVEEVEGVEVSLTFQSMVTGFLGVEVSRRGRGGVEEKGRGGSRRVEARAQFL